MNGGPLVASSARGDAPAGGAARAASGHLAGALVTGGLVMVIACNALLAANDVRVLRAGLAAVAYPFELDFAEGLVLTSTRALADGHAVYPPPETLPARISNYTPLYYAAAAALGTLVGDYLAAGRAVSLASALLAAALLALLSWRATDRLAGRWVRAATSAFAGLAFLQISYTASWAALMRVDLLAVLLAVAGVVVFGTTAARGRQVYWCLLPLLAAAYTKQTTLAAAGAVVVAMALSDLRRGLALGGAFAVAGLLLAGTLQVVTQGGFAFHVLSGNVHPYSLHQVASLLQDIAIRYPVLVALAAVSVPGLLTSVPHSSFGTALRAAPGAPEARLESRRAYTRTALGAYLPLAGLAALTAGKLGAEVNYFIELMAVVCACTAVTLADALQPVHAGAEPSAARAVVAFAVPALLLWQIGRVAPPASIESIEVPPAAEQTQVAELVEIIRRADGPVLSEDLTLLNLAGKPIAYQPFDLAQLVRRRVRDETPLIAALDKGALGFVVLRFDVRTPPPIALSRFTPAMIDAIRARYVLVSTYPGYWLYAPKALPGATHASPLRERGRSTRAAHAAPPRQRDEAFS